MTESVRLYGNVHALWLQRPDTFASAVPGQFVMAFAGDSDDPYLGVPLSIAGMRDFDASISGRNEVQLLVTAHDPVTSWLTRRRTGDVVRLVGPLGSGFTPRGRVQHMLVVAEGEDIGAATWLASRLAADGREVTLVLGGATEATIYPAALLPSEVEVVVATADGSLGETGGVIGSVELLLVWCDQAFLVTSVETHQEVYQLVRAHGTEKPVQVLLQSPMPCGTGLCDGCTVFPRRGGVRLVCTDGPVFDLRDLYA